MKTWAVLFIALFAASQTHAQNRVEVISAKAAPLVLGPDWARLPDWVALMPLFPQRARQNAVAGYVRLGCEVTAEGRPANCVVLLECPAGYGFGQASLDGAKTFDFAPKTVAGRAVPGHIVVPVSWSAPLLSPRDCPAGSIRKPIWEHTPDPSEQQSLFPARALADGENGAVRVLCDVDRDGGMQNCAVNFEYPEGYGFGSASLSLAAQYKVDIAKTIMPGQARTVDIDFGWSAARRNIPDPVWVERPSKQELEELAPPKGKSDGVSGSAKLICEVGSDYRLSACQVLEEVPKDYGYGEAAVRASHFFRIATHSADGLPVLSGQPFADPTGVMVEVKW